MSRKNNTSKALATNTLSAIAKPKNNRAKAVPTNMEVSDRSPKIETRFFIMVYLLLPYIIILYRFFVNVNHSVKNCNHKISVAYHSEHVYHRKNAMPHFSVYESVLQEHLLCFYRCIFVLIDLHNEQQTHQG